MKAKRQLCEDAIMHQERVNDFEYECNTKSTQTEITLENFPDLNLSDTVGVNEQCDFEILNFEQPKESKIESELQSKQIQNLRMTIVTTRKVWHQMMKRR